MQTVRSRRGLGFRKVSYFAPAAAAPTLDTLSTFSTSRVLRLHADLPSLEDRDPSRGGYGDFGLIDSDLVDGFIAKLEHSAFQICFDHKKY